MIYSNSYDVVNMANLYISFVCDNVLRKRQRLSILYKQYKHIYQKWCVLHATIFSMLLETKEFLKA